MKNKCEMFVGTHRLLAVLPLTFIAISSFSHYIDDAMGQNQGRDLELKAGNDDLPDRVNVTVNNFNLTADVALTPKEQSKGLSIKDNLQENEGMIFPYKTPQILSFWMKDMKFPIDIIWLDGDKRVIHIEESLQPCSPLFPCPSYSPEVLSQYVLETVAGFSNEKDVTIGTQVEFNLSKQG